MPFVVETPGHSHRRKPNANPRDPGRLASAASSHTLGSRREVRRRPRTPEAERNSLMHRHLVAGLVGAALAMSMVPRSDAETRAGRRYPEAPRSDTIDDY